MSTYYDPETAVPMRCDCEPPREPVIWHGEKARELYIAAGLPKEAAPWVEYVATCPDFPGGCEWIEGHIDTSRDAA